MLELLLNEVYRFFLALPNILGQFAANIGRKIPIVLTILGATRDPKTQKLRSFGAMPKVKNSSALALTPLLSPSKREQNGFLSPPSQPLPSQSAPSLVGEQTILLPQPTPSPSIVDELIPTSQPILTIPPLLTPTIPDELIDPVLRGLSASDAMVHSAPPAGSSGSEMPGDPTQPSSPLSPSPPILTIPPTVDSYYSGQAH
ncbi:hypothetical protein BT96DRAFT_998579 [Gymnopus androsaceus JB14]|uniref:Uncharacterized protein n=1 Tax=Gymnopus androsaceus JB14 TaxID=1447944 RepID=A0A6A4H999_9AGAR|nr:hypothetical protein BT96DRAFT_998579 [Gymnopus androsaceus JB14]